MGRTAKIAVLAALAGLAAALALLAAPAPSGPGASASPVPGAEAPSRGGSVPARCRVASVADAQCAAAWEAKRRAFFDRREKDQ